MGILEDSNFNPSCSSRALESEGSGTGGPPGSGGIDCGDGGTGGPPGSGGTDGGGGAAMPAGSGFALANFKS